MNTGPDWGVVATIHAPTEDILSFAAYHLDLGAARVHIYLDKPNAEAQAALERHPACNVIHTNKSYWQQDHGYRPVKHQVRQALNATHCLQSDPQVDWLAHIDVDEFLWPAGASVSAQLADLPFEILSACIRPIEALAPDPDDPPEPGQIWFKSCARRPRQRHSETAVIYPDHPSLKCGFLSHVQGKVLVRTGVPGVILRIHRAEIDGQRDEPAELPGLQLCHLHAPDFERWRARLEYRLARGAYRDGIKPPRGSDTTLNTHLAALAADGEDALRAFFTETCTATPDLRARLEAHGRLQCLPLDPDAARRRHFPNQ